MTIETSTRELLGLIEVYPRERDAVMHNVTLSKTGQQQQIDNLKETYKGKVERVLTALWGNPEPDGPMGWMLSESGEVWRELASAEQSLNFRKAEAARAGIDPLWLPLGKARAASLVINNKTPDKLRAAYDNADQDTKIGLQEFSAELLHSRLSVQNMGWLRVYEHIEADKQARLNTPQVQAAIARATEVNNRVAAAWEATRQAQRTFAIDSWLLINILGGVKYHRRMVNEGVTMGQFPTFEISFERVHGGGQVVETNANGSFMIVSSPTNNPNSGNFLG